jgi:hypothetical protein
VKKTATPARGGPKKVAMKRAPVAAPEPEEEEDEDDEQEGANGRQC